jgi:hypothetical protein
MANPGEPRCWECSRRGAEFSCVVDRWGRERVRHYCAGCWERRPAELVHVLWPRTGRESVDKRGALR